MTIEQTYAASQIEDLKTQVRRQASTIIRLNVLVTESVSEYSTLQEMNERKTAQYDALAEAIDQQELPTVTRLSMRVAELAMQNESLKEELESLREIHRALNAQVMQDLDAEAEANRALREEITREQ